MAKQSPGWNEVMTWGKTWTSFSAIHLPQNKQVGMAKQSPCLNEVMTSGYKRRARSLSPAWFSRPSNEPTQPSHCSSLADIPSSLFANSNHHWGRHWQAQTVNQKCAANTLLILKPYNFSSLAEADIRAHFLPTTLYYSTQNCQPRFAP